MRSVSTESILLKLLFPLIWNFLDLTNCNKEVGVKQDDF